MGQKGLWCYRFQAAGTTVASAYQDVLVTNWTDDFDDDITVPATPRQPAAPFDDFDDDLTVPVSTGGGVVPPGDDFDDDLTTAFNPGATRWETAASTAPSQASPDPQPATAILPPPPSHASPPAPSLPSPPRHTNQPWTPPQRPTAPPPQPIASKRPPIVLLLVAGAVVAIAIAVAAFLILGGGEEPAEIGLGIMGFVQ